MKTKYSSLKSLVAYEDMKRPIHWPGVFGNDNPLDIEIGFGNGDFLTRIAHAQPQRNFIGVEQYWERVCKTLRKIAQNDIANARLLLVDARLAFERLIPPATIENIYCLFPCPWPKKGHIKHRLFSKNFLKLLNSRLINTGRLTIVTDFLPFQDWILGQVRGTGFRVETKTTQPKYNTKYERKWSAEGQDQFYELHMFKNRHVDIPFKEDADVKTYVVEDFNPRGFTVENQKGEISIIFKEYLYDEKNKKAMVRLVVSEENLTQHVWVAIVQTKTKWTICPLDGQRFLPTAGAAQAFKLVYEVCQKKQSIVQ